MKIIFFLKSTPKITAGFILLLFLTNNLSALPLGYTYKKDVTIDFTNVTGTTNHIDFPLLFNVTDPDLRSVSNGGKVNNANGYDIVFTQENCLLDLDHQVEYYNPVSGQLIAWVKLPILYLTQNTIFSMYYGNPTIVASTSKTSTWNSTYESVLHLSENPTNASPQMIDGSGKNNSGTCQGAMNASNMVAGIVSGGLSFDELNDRIVIPDFDYANTRSFSISFWFQETDLTGNSYQYMYSHGAYGTFHSTNIYFGEASLGITADQNMLKTIFQDANDATSTDGFDAGNSLGDGNWHYYVFTVNDLGNPTVYIDGNAVANITFNGGQDYNPITDIFWGSRSDLNATRFYGGNLDECRILNDSLNSGWIQTEYTNISNPTAFYSIGSEQPSSAGCAPLPIASLYFDAALAGENNVNLTVTLENNITGKELLIEKSNNTVDWENFISTPIQHYTNQTWNIIDNNPYKGQTYYRVKKIKYDNSNEYSDIETVFIDKIEIQNIYPMPVQREATIEIMASLDDMVSLQIIDASGKEIAVKLIALKKGVNRLTVDCQNYSAGIYLLKITTSDKQYVDSALLLKSDLN